MTGNPQRGREFSRRGLLAASGVGALGLAGAGAAIAAARGGEEDGRDGAPRPTAAPTLAVVPFHADHQAGIATPAQDRLAFAAFDVVDGARRDDVVALLREWTAAAAAMTTGEDVPGDNGNPLAPPADTGEAVGLHPAALTITAGFGPSLFDHRFGLTDRRPAALAPLPAFPGDQLEPDRCDGDLGVQACSDDPQVAFHAVRNLARLGRGVVTLRWFQLGFGRTSKTAGAQATPRNLMGFKDGTRNIVGEDATALRDHVWVGPESDQRWLRGGSYLVVRRIRMLIEAWDRDHLADQEAVFGRRKQSGAPLNGTHEFDPPDFAAIAPDAHIRLASPETNAGIRILRRGYSYTDGMDPATGQLDAGLFFACYQRDPRQGFIPLQRRLAQHDALNEYISHRGSALFACPPGVRDPSDWWGRALFT